jgi:hypothetical protein
VTLAATLSPAQARCALALALAHRALGHWGNTLAQDIEARTLATSWLMPSLPPRASPAELAELFAVTDAAARVRLGLACAELTNLELHRGELAHGCAGGVMRNDSVTSCVIGLREHAVYCTLEA